MMNTSIYTRSSTNWQRNIRNTPTTSYPPSGGYDAITVRGRMRWETPMAAVTAQPRGYARGCAAIYRVITNTTERRIVQMQKRSLCVLLAILIAAMLFTCALAERAGYATLNQVQQLGGELTMYVNLRDK